MLYSCINHDKGIWWFDGEFNDWKLQYCFRVEKLKYFFCAKKSISAKKCTGLIFCRKKNSGQNQLSKRSDVSDADADADADADVVTRRYVDRMSVPENSRFVSESVLNYGCPRNSFTNNIWFRDYWTKYQNLSVSWLSGIDKSKSGHCLIAAAQCPNSLLSFKWKRWKMQSAAPRGIQTRDPQFCNQLLFHLSRVPPQKVPKRYLSYFIWEKSQFNPSWLSSYLFNIF